LVNLEHDFKVGKDHASPRYIFTKLDELTNCIFKKEDNYLLNYINDDGLKIEPDFYLPIISMILVNGTEGNWELGFLVLKYHVLIH